MQPLTPGDDNPSHQHHETKLTPRIENHSLRMNSTAVLERVIMRVENHSLRMSSTADLERVIVWGGMNMTSTPDSQKTAWRMGDMMPETHARIRALTMGGMASASQEGGPATPADAGPRAIAWERIRDMIVAQIRSRAGTLLHRSVQHFSEPCQMTKRLAHKILISGAIGASEGA